MASLLLCLFVLPGYVWFPALRAQFVLECLADLKKNLIKRGLDLLIKQGNPEDILPSLAKAFGAHTVKRNGILMVDGYICVSYCSPALCL